MISLTNYNLPTLMASFMATSIVSDPGTARPPNRSHCRGPDLQFASTGTRPEKITERPW